MSTSLAVVIASRQEEQALRVRRILDQDDTARTMVKALGNGNMDPLDGLVDQPDLLILILGPSGTVELDALSTHTAAKRPPLVVLAPPGNAAQMRRAMQAGARDFLDADVGAEELLACVRQVAAEAAPPPLAEPAGPASLTAIINSKGGSGASFIASNLAHVFAVANEQRVALLDLDLQFGAQDLCLDVKPRTGLVETVSRAEQIDNVALESCMGVHASGVRLLGEYGSALALSSDVNRAGLERLLKVAMSQYDQVVVDLPRQIDPLTSTTLEAATLVCVVMNQSLIHLRDTKRMLQILTRDLGIQRNRIRVVVNRYLPDAAVTLRDIQAAADVETLVQIPNDFRRASESINLGTPVLVKNPSAAITKAFLDLASSIAGAPRRKPGGLRGALAGLFGGSAGER